MNTRIIERMIQGETSANRCKQNRCTNTHLHVAAIVKNGQVLATAENRIGTRSRGSGYSNQTIHAERAVFKKLGDYTKLRGATLCVWRVYFWRSVCVNMDYEPFSILIQLFLSKHYTPYTP